VKNTDQVVGDLVALLLRFLHLVHHLEGNRNQIPKSFSRLYYSCCTFSSTSSNIFFAITFIKFFFYQHQFLSAHLICTPPPPPTVLPSQNFA
jgi:hypothetical protein